jgi:hypothetical protein
MYLMHLFIYAIVNCTCARRHSEKPLGCACCARWCVGWLLCTHFGAGAQIVIAGARLTFTRARALCESRVQVHTKCSVSATVMLQFPLASRHRTQHTRLDYVYVCRPAVCVYVYYVHAAAESHARPQTAWQQSALSKNAGHQPPCKVDTERVASIG